MENRAGYSRVISWSISMPSSESAVWLGLEHVGWSIRGLGLMGLWLWSGRYGLCAFEVYGVWVLMLRVWTDYLRLLSSLCDVVVLWKGLNDEVCTLLSLTYN
jgi:hypothetical protein